MAPAQERGGKTRDTEDPAREAEGAPLPCGLWWLAEEG